MKSEDAAHNLMAMLSGVLPPGEPVVQVVQGDIIRLDVGRSAYLVKWIADDNRIGQNEVQIGRLLAGQALLWTPRLVFEKQVEGGIVAGWEWLEGHDLRITGREHLPEVFHQLGEFHWTMQNHAAVVAPLNQTSFATVPEMLAFEGMRLGSFFQPDLGPECTQIMARLEVGYPTLIHGDMHPGNMILSGRQAWFVDWSYACNSLNLLDLDYIQCIALGDTEPSWPIIRPAEAPAVLAAYFEGAGLSHLNPIQIHQAVMVWNLLRTYENAVQNGYHAEIRRVRRQLNNLLALIRADDTPA